MIWYRCSSGFMGRWGASYIISLREMVTPLRISLVILGWGSPYPCYTGTTIISTHLRVEFPVPSSLITTHYPPEPMSRSARRVPPKVSYTTRIPLERHLRQSKNISKSATATIVFSSCCYQATYTKGYYNKVPLLTVSTRAPHRMKLIMCLFVWEGDTITVNIRSFSRLLN